MSETAPWITYRPELKVLDCTIRDGGLINNHLFTDEVVRAVYDTASQRASITWRSATRTLLACSPQANWPLAALRRSGSQSRVPEHDADETGLKLCAMADAARATGSEQIVPASESVLDMIRVAFYAHQVSEAVEMINHCDSLGYERRPISWPFPTSRT